MEELIFTENFATWVVPGGSAPLSRPLIAVKICGHLSDGTPLDREGFYLRGVVKTLDLARQHVLFHFSLKDCEDYLGLSDKEGAVEFARKSESILTTACLEYWLQNRERYIPVRTAVDGECRLYEVPEAVFEVIRAKSGYCDRTLTLEDGHG